MLDTDELSAALHAATATIEAPPGFPDKVRRGARRRLARRRYRIGVVALVVLLIGGGLDTFADYWLPIVTGTHNLDLPGDDPRLHAATRGDLATDQDFLGQVSSMWQSDVSRRELERSAAQSYGGDAVAAPSGPLNVYWAGNTPDGPAAVVLQRFISRSTGGERPLATVVEIGVVADDASDYHLALVAEQTIGKPGPDQAGDSFGFGPDDATVLTMAESGFQVYSPNPIVDPSTGKVTRHWQDLPYIDGVAVFEVDRTTANGWNVAELPHRPDAAHTYAREPGLTSPYQPTLASDSASTVDPRLRWPSLPEPTMGSLSPNRPDWSSIFDNALHAGGYTDPYVPKPANLQLPGTAAATDGESYWQIPYELPSGQTVILGEALVGVSGRLYAVTVDQQDRVLNVVYGGEIDPANPLPVRFALPQGQGWLLAAYGSVISTPGQSNNDLLIVPASTTTVTVTPKGGQPQTITVSQYE